jgi:CRISPR-associated protein Cas1
MDAPLIRVMALHALGYCERLFYLEEVEQIRVADRAVFAGRSLHEELRQAEEETGEWSSMEMSSEELGIAGKTDCLRRFEGSIIPYEHKKGRPNWKKGKAEAWPSDLLQIGAYGMLLEEKTGCPVPEGRIRYHNGSLTVRVPMDEEVREKVKAAISRARELTQSTSRPPITDNDRLCIKCSLAPVCLPEEERMASDESWEAIRLFPPDREAKVIYVLEPGARIGKSGDCIRVRRDTKEKKEENVDFPISDVSSIVLHGYPQLTTQALHFCMKNNVSIHWVTGSGNYVAGLSPGAGGVQRKIRQYEALTNPEVKLRLARKLALAKVEGELRYALRATRGDGIRSGDIKESIGLIRSSLRRIGRSERLDSIRGYEGMAGRAYFSILPCLLKESVPDEMMFTTRNRRPPRDRFNALLSFGYSLLYQAVMTAVLGVGLEPALGFFHTPRSSAYPLVMDLMELFRVPLWDMPLIGSINRLHWNPDMDFDVGGGRVYLSDSGRRKAITLFEKRLEETWKHPVLDYSMSYSRLMELEVRLLEKEWMGKPGLFARMRLR